MLGHLEQVHAWTIGWYREAEESRLAKNARTAARTAARPPPGRPGGNDQSSSASNAAARLAPPVSTVR